MKTLRFWVYWRGGPVKLALRDGQSLAAGFHEPTDEGWNSEGSTWSRKGDEVTEQWWSDGRDCDGRLSRQGTCRCHARDLFGGIREENDPDVAYPMWHAVDSSQRDYSAEAMGY